MTDGSSKYLFGLIGANVVVFIAIAVSGLSDPSLTQSIVTALSLGNDLHALADRPWTLLTYSFVNANILQLIFNMLWLYGFGRLLMLRYSAIKLLTLYAAGSLVGGCMFVGLFGVAGFGPSGLLMGSSASVIAVAVAVALVMPDTEVYVPLLGPTKIKWVVIVVIALFGIGLSAPNAGGNLAHIGGAIAGAAYGLTLRFMPKSVSDDCSEYDRLISKIKSSGYDSMTAREKRRFFELSRKK